jgi:hypothetical protein
MQMGIVVEADAYYLPLIDEGSQNPDRWYENDPIPFALQMNHGFVPLGISPQPLPFIIPPPQIVGVGFAPDNFGKYAELAKQEFASRDYDNAFRDMAYASHFISDLGNPFHTPMVQIMPLQFVDSPYSLIVFPNTQMILDYKSLHDSYENYVDADFTSFGTTSESNVPADPTNSAKVHGVYSWAANYPLMYSCYWHYMFTRGFDFGTNPAIVAITQNRVMETAKLNNGLVQYVTGGRPITFTITPIAGSGGSITPSSPVTINYGESQTFTIQAAPNYVIDDVRINGVSIGSIDQYTFGTETLNKARGDQTLEATFKSTAPPQGPSAEWIWSRDGWGDWEHSASWTGTELGLNSEYGPVMVNGHGEHGTITHLYGGTIQASVWRTFTDPSGVGWNTLTFTGLLPRSDLSGGRWMTIDVNGQRVLAVTEADTPPGQWSEPFEFRVPFPRTDSATVNISHGQYSAWGPNFYLEYDSLRLSLEPDSQVASITTPSEIYPENVIVANMTETEARATGQ